MQSPRHKSFPLFSLPNIGMMWVAAERVFLNPNCVYVWFCSWIRSELGPGGGPTVFVAGWRCRHFSWLGMAAKLRKRRWASGRLRRGYFENIDEGRPWPVQPDGKDWIYARLLLITNWRSAAGGPSTRKRGPMLRWRRAARERCWSRRSVLLADERAAMARRVTRDGLDAAIGDVPAC